VKAAHSVDKRSMEKKLTMVSTRLLACQECGRPWLDPRERWRLYVDTDEPAQTVPYCPRCADREFGAH
jgi:hypothetical protein